MEGGEDLGGRRTPFRRVSFSLQTSLISPNFPARQPPYWFVKTFLAFLVAVAVQGSFLSVWEVGFCHVVRLRARLVGEAFGDDAIHECRDSACRRPFGVRRNAAGVCSEMTRRLGTLWNITYSLQCCYLLIYDYDAIHECRDSACRRPFGVRLRGNDWFRRSPLHRCAAPLRMTQWVCRIVGCNLFVIMLL